MLIEVKSPEEFHMTRKIFWAFVCASIATLVYFNLTNEAYLKMLLDQFPEIDSATRAHLASGYKMGVSVAIFLVDIVLVGPFAYLSYYSEHISPSPGKIVNYLSFFDFGILLAFVFTLASAAAHFYIISAVAEPGCNYLVAPKSAALAFGAVFVVWCALLTMKFYSYPKDKRRELKKYAIRF